MGKANLGFQCTRYLEGLIAQTYISMKGNNFLPKKSTFVSGNRSRKVNKKNGS